MNRPTSAEFRELDRFASILEDDEEATEIERRLAADYGRLRRLEESIRRAMEENR